MTKLKQARMRKGLSIYEVAEKVGITAGQVSKIERRLCGISPRNAPALADVLGLTLDEVLGFDQEHEAA